MVVGEGSGRPVGGCGSRGGAVAGFQFLHPLIAGGGALGYGPVTADSAAKGRRCRAQVRKIDADPVLAARVRADLRRSRTPRQIAGRLRLEATDATVERMNFSPDAEGRSVSHESIYRWIYALPKGELARQGILLRSKRSSRQRRRPVGERTWDRIAGMVSIDDRPEHVADRKVPGCGKAT